MKFTIMDEQEVRSFAQANAPLLKSVLTNEARPGGEEEHFFGEAAHVALFLSFAKSLSSILEGTLTVTKILGKSQELFTWIHEKPSIGKEPVKAALAERILILAFEAYANRKAGIKADALSTILGENQAEIEKNLTLLEDRGVLRKSRDGHWKYIRSV